MNKYHLFLFMLNNSIVWRKKITAPGKHHYEAMQVEQTLMLPEVDHDALFELAYEAGQQEPNNVAIGRTLEEALRNLVIKCGLEPWEELEPEVYPARCYNCDGIGEWHGCSISGCRRLNLR